MLEYTPIWVGMALFIFGYLERWRSERRRRTQELLLSFINEDAVNDANLEIALWVKQGRVIEDDNVTPNDAKVIIYLLNYFDLISDSAERGILDKKMTLLHLGGRMRSTYNMTAKYIEDRRSALNRPGLYKPLETFVKERVKDRKV